LLKGLVDKGIDPGKVDIVQCTKKEGKTRRRLFRPARLPACPLHWFCRPVFAYFVDMKGKSWSLGNKR
jgi:hypothetical protein